MKTYPVVWCSKFTTTPLYRDKKWNQCLVLCYHSPHLLMLSDTFRTLIVLIEKHLHRSTAPLKVLHLVADNQTFSVSCPDITVAQLSWWAAHRFYVWEETIRNWLEKPLGPFLSSDNRAGCVTGSRAGLQALAGCCMHLWGWVTVQILTGQKVILNFWGKYRSDALSVSPLLCPGLTMLHNLNIYWHLKGYVWELNIEPSKRRKKARQRWREKRCTYAQFSRSENIQ